MGDIPKSLRVNTGDQHRVQPAIDIFFAETRSYIADLYKFSQVDFRILSGEIALNPLTVTDNRVSYLLCKERVVAIVMETRTDLNFVQYDFFRNLDSLNDLRK